MIRRLIDRFKCMRNPINYWKSKGLRIGNNCKLMSPISFGSEPYLITIGNSVRINSNVVFVTHDGGVWVLRNKYNELSDVDKFGTICVGNNVHIGTNAVIMPGVTIGDNCIIGVGAVVTKDIPANTVAVGVPARVIETIEEYKEKNIGQFLHTKGMTAEEKKKYLSYIYNRDN